MKKNKKKIIIITILLLLFVALFGLVYISFGLKDKNALTLEENKWIEDNKRNIIDIAIINDIPVLSYDGEGLIYNYLDYIKQQHSLNFNVVPYKLDSTVEYEYKMDIVSTISDGDVVLLKDNLVLMTNNNIEYSDIKDIVNLKVGILSADKEILTSYFNQNNIQFIEYTNYTELKQAFADSIANKDSGDSVINSIVIPKTIFTKEIIENDYKISFDMNDLNKYFVIKTNGASELNSIINKSFNTWKNDNYEKEYNESLLANYYEFKNIADTDQKKLQSKNYVYGFIDYGIYNNLNNNKISGLNELVLKDFNKFSGLAISYTKYNSINKLLKDFNSNKVDFMLNIASEENYNVEIYNTVGVFNKQLAVISGISNIDVIDNINSLKEKTVLTVKDSYLEKYLIDNGIKVKSYNNFDDLANDFSLGCIAIVDLENYNYYKSSAFKDCKINYLLNMEGKYNFVLRNTEENNIFIKMFDFYLNYNSMNKLKSLNYLDIAYENSNILFILIIIIFVLCIYMFIDFSNHIKVMFKSIKKRKKMRLTKEEKIKYIDQLTSLKNRAYLNSRIESWDDSEVYPQAIIVIDLNNISYINDNYGREEGDKVITEAANVLIQHQLQNSEIIRTDGNEFLIYLVGYSEKQIISYLRKLNKELKTLDHGFGAASGYSIITDAIKTVDDAVNEATLDMKNNKEDIDY